MTRATHQASSGPMKALRIHPPGDAEDRTLRLQLELQLDRQPISGRIRTVSGAEKQFDAAGGAPGG